MREDEIDQVIVDAQVPWSDPCNMRIVLRSEMFVRAMGTLGDDTDVALAAWTSSLGDELPEDYLSEDGSVSPAKIRGLIRYLMRQRHGTPFEHGCLRFLIRVPIFVWREWHRHRIASYNEESARYKTLEPVFWIPKRERPAIKVGDWKPGRPKFEDMSDHTWTCLVRNLAAAYKVGYRNYLANLEMNVDPGIARACLPVGIYSRCWVTLNPRALMHFLSLRTHEPEAKFVSYPLYEIEEAARLCEGIFAKHWPETYAAFNEFGRVAP